MISRSESRLGDRLAGWPRRFAYSARYLMNAYPAVYVPYTRLRRRGQENWAVSPETELVIEGFGRAGNTFAATAFEMAQDRPVRTVHHTHSPAMVITAVRMGVPTVVLVRKPEEAALSHMLLRGVPAKAALSAWVRFHRRIAPYRDRIVAAGFEDVITDFGAVIRRVNERFGASFGEFDHTKENEARVLEAIDRLNLERPGNPREFASRPSAEREARKAALRAEYDDPRLATLRARAAALYELLTG